MPLMIDCLRWGVLALALICAPADAEQSACPGEYAGNQRPDIAGREICRDQFALVYDDAAHVPLISAEHLTRAEVKAAARLHRSGSFHDAAGVSPDDYTRSGYDRGHMTPSGDMPTRRAQRQSFAMDNITPQRPGLNQRAWRDLEASVRQLASDAGDVYVITGAVLGSGLVHGEIAVPRLLYKAVLVPSSGTCWVAVARNNDGATVQTMSVDDFAAHYGVELFPAQTCGGT